MIAFARATDRDLMRRFRAGDRDAFTEIYRAHSPAVHRFALHMTGDSGKAIEITQDVFVWLIHHPDGFDPIRGDLGAFLTGVARKFVQRRWQQEKRWVQYDETATPSVQPATGDGDEDKEQLRSAIAALPERYREVVVLCDLEETSYEDAASQLECATGTVRSRLHRARTLLARKLLGVNRKVKEAVRYSA
ncbi:MAG: polymerase, sigma-24 subunit, subfamily [Bryobacterales bacterium]|nr:polymerase, sigma-24 subunit, subfamily [Bryobacterales bacterium]